MNTTNPKTPEDHPLIPALAALTDSGETALFAIREILSELRRAVGELAHVGAALNLPILPGASLEIARSALAVAQHRFGCLDRVLEGTAEITAANVMAEHITEIH